MRCLLRLSILVVVTHSLGCGSQQSSQSFVPVSGRVMFDSRPVVNANVRFQPVKREAGKIVPESYGETDDKGFYTLRPITDKAEDTGAVPGEYLIQISLFDRDRGSGREMLPFKYNRESKLSFTVPAEGTKEANFNLTSR